MKIALLFFLSIYSRCDALASWATRVIFHYNFRTQEHWKTCLNFCFVFIRYLLNAIKSLRVSRDEGTLLDLKQFLLINFSDALVRDLLIIWLADIEIHNSQYCMITDPMFMLTEIPHAFDKIVIFKTLCFGLILGKQYHQDP